VVILKYIINFLLDICTDLCQVAMSVEAGRLGLGQESKRSMTKYQSAHFSISASIYQFQVLSFVLRSVSAKACCRNDDWSEVCGRHISTYGSPIIC
jgi:hypothetical protein